MQVEIDSDRCQGHGRCVAICPEVFEVDDAGYGLVVAADVPPDLEAKVRQAELNCPEGAIVAVATAPSSAETREMP